MPIQPIPQGSATVEMAMGKPKVADPVDELLAKELSERRDVAANEATYHEEQAARFRAFERACGAGIQQLSMPQELGPEPEGY